MIIFNAQRKEQLPLALAPTQPLAVYKAQVPRHRLCP